MEKIFDKVKRGPEFLAGQKEFREGKIKKSNVKYSWYAAVVTTKKWNEYYSKIPGGYTYLNGDKEHTRVGFLAVIPPDGCPEITDVDELMKIDAHRRAINFRPFVTEDKG